MIGKVVCILICLSINSSLFASPGIIGDVLQFANQHALIEEYGLIQKQLREKVGEAFQQPELQSKDLHEFMLLIFAMSNLSDRKEIERSVLQAPYTEKYKSMLSPLDSKQILDTLALPEMIPLPPNFLNPFDKSSVAYELLREIAIREYGGIFVGRAFEALVRPVLVERGVLKDQIFFSDFDLKNVLYRPDGRRNQDGQFDGIILHLGTNKLVIEKIIEAKALKQTFHHPQLDEILKKVSGLLWKIQTPAGERVFTSDQIYFDGTTLSLQNWSKLPKEERTQSIPPGLLMVLHNKIGNFSSDNLASLYVEVQAPIVSRVTEIVLDLWLKHYRFFLRWNAYRIQYLDRKSKESILENINLVESRTQMRKERFDILTHALASGVTLDSDSAEELFRIFQSQNHTRFIGLQRLAEMYKEFKIWRPHALDFINEFKIVGLSDEDVQFVLARSTSGMATTSARAKFVVDLIRSEKKNVRDALLKRPDLIEVYQHDPRSIKICREVLRNL